jgi:putative inorganic carbon (HCO3(-)) transporter
VNWRGSQRFQPPGRARARRSTIAWFPTARQFHYTRLSTTAQVALLVPLLVTFALTSQPALLAVEALALAGLFYLDLAPALPLIAFYIPFSAVYKHAGPAGISPTEVLVVACAVAWATQIVRRRGLGRPSVSATTLLATAKGLSSLDWAVLFFVALCCLSLASATDLLSATWVLRTVVIEPVLLYLFIRNYPLGRASLLRLADALVLGALAVALIGLFQYFFTAYVEAVEGVRRILSVYDSPNHLALYLGRVMPIAFCLALFAPGTRRRLLHGLALVPLALCLFLTYSRGAWLLGLPAALLCIGLLRGRRARLASLGAVLLALLAVLPFARTARFASLLNLASGTSFNRLVLWQGALRLVLAHPLLGVGIGNFQAQYPLYMLPEAWREPNLYHPHNVLLEFWAGLGILGIVALVWFIVTFCRAGLGVYRRLRDPDLRALVLGLFAGMAVLLAHGLVDSGYFLTDLAFLFMLSLGLLRRIERDMDTCDAPVGADQDTGLRR